MRKGKGLWIALGLVAMLPILALANGTWVTAGMPTADSAIWLIDNTTGGEVTGLHIEFSDEVTIVGKVDVGGNIVPVGELTGTSFDFVGELCNLGTVIFEWQPIDAVPALVQWLSGTNPVGAPFFTSVQILGQLLAQGIVAAREADPAGMTAAFQQFFADNADYLASLSESLGMSLADSLMPIIMSSPAEGIENFFNTVIGMLGVTSLDDLLNGAVDFSALLKLVGLQ